MRLKSRRKAGAGECMPSADLHGAMAFPSALVEAETTGSDTSMSAAQILSAPTPPGQMKQRMTTQDGMPVRFLLQRQQPPNFDVLVRGSPRKIAVGEFVGRPFDQQGSGHAAMILNSHLVAPHRHLSNHVKVPARLCSHGLG